MHLNSKVELNYKKFFVVCTFTGSQYSDNNVEFVLIESNGIQWNVVKLKCNLLSIQNVKPISKQRFKTSFFASG